MPLVIDCDCRLTSIIRGLIVRAVHTSRRCRSSIPTLLSLNADIVGEHATIQYHRPTQAGRANRHLDLGKRYIAKLLQRLLRRLRLKQPFAAFPRGVARSGPLAYYRPHVEAGRQPPPVSAVAVPTLQREGSAELDASDSGHYRRCRWISCFRVALFERLAHRRVQRQM